MLQAHSKRLPLAAAKNPLELLALVSQYSSLKAAEQAGHFVFQFPHTTSRAFSLHR
jgi:hypothetical protein